MVIKINIIGEFTVNVYNIEHSKPFQVVPVAFILYCNVENIWMVSSQLGGR